MSDDKLKIGKIPYSNLFPIYYYLENECRRPEFSFKEGVPSQLNRMLRNGEVDVSPSSSIEYLRHKNIYSIIPWTSISATGTVGSIYLFSSTKLESLNNAKISVSSQSETSVVLLKIIMKEFMSLDCSYETTESGSVEENLKEHSATLLIGDEAMREAKNFDGNIYDLGGIWHKHTGLPFVFALWITRKDSLPEKKELLKKLSDDLVEAKSFSKKNLHLLAQKAPQNMWLSEHELVAYWNGISYDFTDEHLEGLMMFEKYANKL